MTERSARLDLPFIMPGQAQKEAYHNEALTTLDGLVHAAVQGAAQSTPPGAPLPGQCWIIGPAATGAWSGKEGKLAAWTSGGWRFLAPVAGMKVWDGAAGYWRHWTGSAWSDGKVPAAGLTVGGQQVVGPRLAALASASGGTTIDLQARSAIAAIIVALKSHGLTD